MRVWRGAAGRRDAAPPWAPGDTTAFQRSFVVTGVDEPLPSVLGVSELHCVKRKPYASFLLPSLLFSRSSKYLFLRLQGISSPIALVNSAACAHVAF